MFRTATVNLMFLDMFPATNDNTCVITDVTGKFVYLQLFYEFVGFCVL